MLMDSCCSMAEPGFPHSPPTLGCPPHSPSPTKRYGVCSVPQVWLVLSQSTQCIHHQGIFCHVVSLEVPPLTTPSKSCPRALPVPSPNVCAAFFFSHVHVYFISKYLNSLGPRVVTVYFCPFLLIQRVLWYWRQILKNCFNFIMNYGL